MKFRHSFAATGLPGLVSVLLSVGASAAPPAARGQSSYPEVFTSTKPPLVVANAGYRLLIDSERGTIVSLRSTFLYHEYANGSGGFFTHRVNDEALRLSAARALVTGYIVSYTLRDKGQIEYDWDQSWTRAVPDQAGILDWTRRITKFRAGIGRDYLVYGRMLRPWKVSGVTERDYGWFGKEPLVQSATWRAQDGRNAVVLANFADLEESPRVELEGRGTKRLIMDLDGEKTERDVELPSTLDVKMQPRSLCLVELK
jgi:hypothetical protein